MIIPVHGISTTDLYAVTQPAHPKLQKLDPAQPTQPSPTRGWTRPRSMGVHDRIGHSWVRQRITQHTDAGMIVGFMD